MDVMEELKAEVLNDFNAFGKIACRWNECVSKWVAPNRAIFMTHEWLSTWWKWFGDGELFVIILRRSDELVALAPMFIRRIQALGGDIAGFIGMGISDYGEVAAKPEEQQKAIFALMSCLALNRHLWDVIELREISLSSPTPRLIEAWCNEEGWKSGIAYQANVSEVCPVLKLPSSYERLLSSVRGNLRTTLMRRERQLRRLFDVEIDVVRDETQRHEVIEQMFRLHARRWQKKLQPGIFSLQSVRNFHREFTRLALNRGWLSMHFMMLDGAYAAVHYCLKFDGAACYYGGGFAPEFGRYSVGTVLMGHAIKGAIESGASVFDFLRGCEEYKLLWGAKPIPNLSVRLFQVGSARSLATISFLRLKDKIIDAAKRLAQKLPSLP